MSTRTADEVKQHHENFMGEELGSLYHALWNEVAWLYSIWSEYVELFGTKPSRIELANQAAGFFFRVVQDSLWEGSLLHLARLTDPSQTSGKENLTIRRLPILIDDDKVREEVEELVKFAAIKSEFCRDWRNRRIAHRDLGLAIGKEKANPLKPASREKVKKALDAISDVLNAVSKHYLDSETMFETRGTRNGVLSLLYVLDDGLRVEDERHARLKSGDYSVQDYQPRDL